MAPKVILLFIVLSMLGIYTLSLLILSSGLQRLTPARPSPLQPFVSVIVPARNEEQNITVCLERLSKQSYPSARYEIIVVDDGSTDRTAKAAAEFSHVQLLRSADLNGLSPKKAALHTGILAARGEIILTTDADCFLPFCWIETMAGAFDENVAAAASWLIVRDDLNLLSRIERLDSFGFVLLGAAVFGLGRPFLANGANLAYRKSVYREIGGFGRNGHFASGDDDLLLQKISQLKSWKCVFVDSKEPVLTRANATWHGFFGQRLRWASKAAAYPKPAVLAEVGIYLFFALIFGLLIMAPFSSPLWLLPFAGKAAADYLFLRRRARSVGIDMNPVIFLLAEITQMFYIMVVGIWANFGRYQWKGRRYVRGRMTTA